MRLAVALMLGTVPFLNGEVEATAVQGAGAVTEAADSGAGTGMNGVPGDILNSWYRADLGITQAGGAVSQWNDLSGNAHHLAQATGSKQPAYSATGGPNSTPCLTADGVNDSMAGSFTVTKPWTVYLVCKWNTAYSVASEILDSTTTSRLRFYRSGSTQVTRFATAGTATTPQSWHYYTIDQNAAVSVVKQDNAQILSGAVPDVDLTGLNLFSFNDGVSNPCNGSIAEIVVVNGIPSAANNAAIVAYFNSRYGL